MLTENKRFRQTIFPLVFQWFEEHFKTEDNEGETVVQSFALLWDHLWNLVDFMLELLWILT
jgi:hypothetical protein